MTAQAAVIPSPADWHGSSELHPYFVCDVFTSEPLQGNQLGVFINGRPFTSAQMQRLARELNVAETVFVLPPADGGDVRVRIFTPGAELPFAGHPVLGTAFVVAGALGTNAVTLETGAGLVPIALERDGDRLVFGRMRQPIPTWEPYGRAGELLAALGAEGSQLPVELYRNGPAHVYVQLASEEAVAALRPTWPPSPNCRWARTASRAAAARGRRGCSTRPSAYRRTRPPARPRARWPSTWPVTAGSGSASRSRSARARRSAGRRCCTRRSPARATDRLRRGRRHGPDRRGASPVALASRPTRRRPGPATKMTMMAAA